MLTACETPARMISRGTPDIEDFELDPRLAQLADAEGMSMIWAEDPETVAARLGTAKRIPTSSEGEPRALYESMFPPHFPIDLAKKGITGYVVLDILIDPEGNTLMVGAKKGSPPGVFVNTSLSAAKLWKYPPLVQGSEMTDRIIEITMTFDLEN